MSQWTNLVAILTRLPQQLRDWFQSTPEGLLAALTQSDIDDQQDARRDAKRIVHEQATIAIIVMADHLESIYRLLHREPLMVYSHWTLARVIQEQASIVLWLLNPHISCQERWARSLNIRLEGLKAQRRVANSNQDFTDNKAIESRLAHLSSWAGTLGISTKGAKNKPNHFGSTGHPRVLDRIKKTLQDETAYRILSAMAHGENWALIRLGFAKDGDDRYGPELSFESVAYLISKTIEWFAKAHWTFGSYYGFDLEVLVATLEEEYEKAGLSDTVRFWREYG